MTALLILVLLAQSATPASRERGRVETADFNFDGHADRRTDGGSNGRYRIWRHELFDPDTGRYVPAPALDALGITTFDPVARHVTSYWVGGHASRLFRAERLRWHGEELVVEQRIWQDTGEGAEGYFRVHSRRERGELHVVSAELITSDLAAGPEGPLPWD